MNLWSLLKRCLRDTYIAVEPFQLFRYVDKQLFRYNNLHMSGPERFVYAMRQIVGSHLYAELTEKVRDACHG